MESYKFVYNDKDYELDEENLDYIMIDEEHPVTGIDLSLILSLLNNAANEINFDVEYYDQPCENCGEGKDDKSKIFKFLEYHFNIFPKNGEYVVSSLSREFENTSYTKLLKYKKADNSFIVSIAVCINCGNYSIVIEECEM